MVIETLPRGYLPLPGGYSYAPLRVGLALRNPAGTDVYFQPGDDETIIRDTIDALGECDCPDMAATMAHISLSDYF